MSKTKNTITNAVPDPKRREGFEMGVNFAVELWMSLYSCTMDIPVLRSTFQAVQIMGALEKFPEVYNLLYGMMMLSDELGLDCDMPPESDAEMVRYFVEGLMVISPDLIDELENEWNETIQTMLEEEDDNGTYANCSVV